MGRVTARLRTSTATVLTALFVVLLIGLVGISVASARQTYDPIPFDVELGSSLPGCEPEGEILVSIPGGESATGEFQAYEGWAYSLNVDAGFDVQQLSVTVSGAGGPSGGFSQTIPAFDSTDVVTSWTASTDGLVSITPSHIIADPDTYDPTGDSMTARIRVVGVSTDDHENDAREGTVIALDEVVSGVFERCDDSDAFEFVAEPGFTYKIHATFDGSYAMQGTFWDVPDIQTADPADHPGTSLEYLTESGLLLAGFAPVRSGPHHFAISVDGSGVNHAYTLKVTRIAKSTTVNSSDAENDGSCDSSHCSLPEAIEESNNQGGIQTIDFDIPGAGIHRISLLRSLPEIIDSVIIDGTSQPGYADSPLVILDGKSAGFTHGLFTGTGFEGQLIVKGLSIVNFENTGISLEGGTGHTLVSNFIGVDPTLSVPAPNLGGGVYISKGLGHVIGKPELGNVIGSNDLFGVKVTGTGVQDLKVEGNWIGTNAEGAKVGNAGPGLFIDGTGTGVVIGRSVPGAGNVFANNTEAGILVDTVFGPADPVIQGNRFLASGDAAVEAIKATLGRSATFDIGGSATGQGNTFTGPFGTAVKVNTTGTQSIDVTYAGNKHFDNEIALHVSEAGDARVTINETQNLFEGDGLAIKAELKAAGTKSFGTGTTIKGSASGTAQVGASFTAEPAAGVKINLNLSGAVESVGTSVETRGAGTVDIEVKDFTVTDTLVPIIGLNIKTGASGKLTLDGFQATNNLYIGGLLEVGKLAGQPITATVDIKNSVIASSGDRYEGHGVGLKTTQTGNADVTWSLSENTFRKKEIGLDISATADAKAAYDLVGNKYEAQAEFGLKANFNPLKNVLIDFSSSGEVFDSNLRHAEFDISGAGNVNIRVLDLTGTTEEGSNIAGLKYHITADVKASLNTNVNLRRTSISGSLGFGVRADIEVPDFGSAFIQADASHFDGNTKGAVLLGWKFEFSDEPNSFSNNSEVGILAEDSIVSITNDTISGNGTGVIVRNGSEVEIADNSITGNAGDGVVVESTLGAFIGSNVVTGNGGAGVVLGPGVTASVSGNTFDGNSGGNVSGSGQNTAEATTTAPEIRSAVLTASGELEITYLIPNAERLVYPLNLAIMNTNGSSDPTDFTSVGSDVVAGVIDAIGTLELTVPVAHSAGVALGDRIVISTVGDPNGGTSSPFEVTAEQLAATATPVPETPEPTASVAPEDTATPEATTVAGAPTVEPTTSVAPTVEPTSLPERPEATSTAGSSQAPTAEAAPTTTEISPTDDGGEPTTEASPEIDEGDNAPAGSCNATSGNTSGTEYVLVAGLMLGLVLRRRVLGKR